MNGTTLPQRFLDGFLTLRAAVLMLVISCIAVTAEAQSQTELRGCGPMETTREILHHGVGLVHGTVHAPRSAVRPENLAWELPIGAGAGLLIAYADVPAADRVQSVTMQHTAEHWSNVGLFTELAVGGGTWVLGCAERKPGLRSTGLAALTAMGAGTAIDAALKSAFNRQYPNHVGPSEGNFWAGGKSFPSGHSAMSFAFASVIAHRYPHNRLVKYSALAFAGAIAASRYPAKQHFLSDILVGSTLGYVIGAQVAEH